MTVRVSKPKINLREKLSELDNPVGNHGAQLMKSVDVAETFNLIGAGRRNIVINGDMSISQRYGTTAHTIPGANTYVLDRWGAWSNQASKFSVQQVADAPTEEGLKYSTKCTSSSAYSAASGDWFGYNYRIEANNITQGLLGTANAKTFTLSFWVKSSVTGSWYGAIRTKGSSPDRSYPFDYTINTANTWEKKTLTFPGAVDGTWGSGTSEGMCLWWDLGSGSNWHGDGYVWHNANKTGADASPFIAVNGATWYITGVQLEIGTVATPFEHRSYNEELSLCQRYFNVWPPRSGGIPAWPVYTGGSQAVACIWIPHTMRTVPTPTDSGTGTSTTTGHTYNNNGTSVSTRYANGTSPTLSCGGQDGHYGLNMHFGAYGGSGGHEADIASWNGTAPGIWLSSEL